MILVYFAILILIIYFSSHYLAEYAPYITIIGISIFLLIFFVTFWWLFLIIAIAAAIWIYFHRRRTDHFQENQEDGPDIFNNVDGSDDLPPKDVTPPNNKTDDNDPD
ncbi:hypothetical protein ACKP2L_05825 [Oenococcus alcoholitolerans]|uniref:hypothetical protein n=1 Tax=Oenococcus alcoholitolerans TaxID=931074 RepID=UPI003F7240BC